MLMNLVGKILSRDELLLELGGEAIKDIFRELGEGRNFTAEELERLINWGLRSLLVPFFTYMFETSDAEDWSVEVKFPEGIYFLSGDYLFRSGKGERKFPIRSIFLPASRGVLINLEDFIDTCGGEGRLKGPYGEFLKVWKTLKGSPIKEGGTSEGLFFKLFKFRYVLRNKKILVEDIKAECLLELGASSSSIRELAPFYLASLGVGKFLLIEEPEAHLHPLFQLNLAYFLSYLVNKRSFYITLITHSDFFTLAIGNLVKLGLLKVKNPTEFERFIKKHKINEDSVLEPDAYIVYLFKRKGKKAFAERIVPDVYGVPPKSFEKIIDTLLSMEEELNELLSF